MIYSKDFGIQLFVLFFLTNVSVSELQCNWKLDFDCWLYCGDGIIANITHIIEEKWLERSECHASGISLELLQINATILQQANWLSPEVKINYLQIGVMIGVNGLEENAFNTPANKALKQLVFTKMDHKTLTKGAFNGLGSLEVLNIKGAYEFRNIDMGILDGLSENLKELTIERSGSYRWAYAYHLRGGYRDYESDDSRNPLRIDVFTGSQQTSHLESVKIRYYLKRLRRESFLSLKKIKILDLSYCGIESIDEGTFDPVIGTVNVIRLTNNPFKKLPAGMLDLMPLRYDTYIFMGQDNPNHPYCACLNVPANYVLRVESCSINRIDEFDQHCNSFLPAKGLIATSSTKQDLQVALSNRTKTNYDYSDEYTYFDYD